MKLGDRLRELRQQREFTLSQLSQQTALSISYLSDLERGQSKPSIDTLERIADAYHILLGQIVAGVDGWTISPQQELASGLHDLIEQGVIDLATAQDLNRIELYGKRLQTAREWHELYLHLHTLLKPYMLPRYSECG